jgi:hypothetical protein
MRENDKSKNDCCEFYFQSLNRLVQGPQKLNDASGEAIHLGTIDRDFSVIAANLLLTYWPVL